METINKIIGVFNNDGTKILYNPNLNILKITNNDYQSLIYLNNIFFENDNYTQKNDNSGFILIHPPENYNHTGSIFLCVSKSIGNFDNELLSIGKSNLYCTDFDDEGQIEQIFFYSYKTNNILFLLSIVRPKQVTLNKEKVNKNDDHNFVAMIDILGFSNILETYSLDEIEKKFCFIIEESLALCDFFNRNFSFLELEEMLNEGIESNNKVMSPILYGIISDSIVLYLNPLLQIDNPFIKLCEFLSVFFELSISHGWLLRGGISYGSFRALRDDSVYIGKALINAHKLEQKQNWAGIIIDDKIIKKNKNEIKNLENRNLILNYNVPIKNENNSPIKNYYVINWTYFSISGINKEIIRESINKMKFKPHNDKSLEALKKVENTDNFFNYLENNNLLFKEEWSKIITINSDDFN